MSLPWLSDLAGITARKDGVVVGTRKEVDFIGDAWSVADDPANARLRVGFTGQQIVDPVTGFTLHLLPQVDVVATSTDATPIIAATIPLQADHDYVMAAYARAYGDTAAERSYQQFDQWFVREGTNNAEALATVHITTVQSAALAGMTGLELVVSATNVIARWTGQAATGLKARIQVGYIARPLVYSPT